MAKRHLSTCLGKRLVCTCKRVTRHLPRQSQARLDGESPVKAPTTTASISHTFLFSPHREDMGLEAESHPKTNRRTSMYICLTLRAVIFSSQPVSAEEAAGDGGTMCFTYEQKPKLKRFQDKQISVAAHGIYPELAGMLKLVKSFQCATSKGKLAMATSFILFHYC